MGTFVLYVARDHKQVHRNDLGSILCMQVLSLIPENVVRVQNCDMIAEKPTWLTGTPTLLDDMSGDVWRGNQALFRLQQLSVSLAKQSSVQERPKKSISHQQASLATRTFQVPKQEEVEQQDNSSDSLWTTQISNDVEDELVGNGKLTSDDLARITSERTQPQQIQQSQGSLPRPPSQMKD